MGVRYFDIRVDTGTSDLRIVHGSVPGQLGDTSLYFSDVAQVFGDFLGGKRHR